MCKKRIKVALIDSGCSFETYEKVAIVVNKEQNIEVVEPKKVEFTHGDAIGKIIKDDEIEIYDVQIFDEYLSTSALHFFGALNYLLSKDIDVINISLGLKYNYKEIKDVCEQLIKKGVVIVASYPRSGGFEVFPASYKDVIKVSSDGMCEEYKISLIDKKNSIFGANPFSSKKEVSGSSVAVAKFTKRFCMELKKGQTKEQILQMFRSDYE